MRRITSPRRLARKRVLLASASLVALAVASSDLRAQSTQSTPATTGAPQGQWSSWSEAGLTGHPALDPAIGLPPLGPVANVDPGSGWEGALGFDYHLGQCGAATAPLLVKAGPPCWLSPYHVSGQFRYGQNNGGSDPFSLTGVNVPFLTTSGTSAPGVVNATGSGTLNSESHWLVDLGVGRDFGLGSGNVQTTLGVRVAEITSTGSGAASVQACLSGEPPGPFCTTPASGGFSFQSRSQFLGVGPRLGINGSQPLAGSWAFDYLGGVAVLFGDRSLNATQTVSATLTISPFTALTSITALNSSSTVGVLNLDAQAGISYWLTQNFKLTASYRFDGYWGAMTIIEPNGAPGQQDRFYYGPMLRGTILF
jgi:opacity protein-like surface antigen